jgi:hypothetical protein
MYDTLGSWETGYVSGEIMTGQTAGYAQITFGQLVVLVNGFEWERANQGDLQKSSNMLGIALQSSGFGSTDIDVLIKGFVSTTHVEDVAAANGVPMYIREQSTVGEMSDTIPQSGYVRLVGYCYQNTNEAEYFILRFDPDNTWVEL